MKGCRPLTPKEIRGIILGMEESEDYMHRNQCILILGVTTGFRISELLSIKVRDVYQDKVVVRNLKIAAASMKGKKRSRIATLPEQSRQAIYYWLDDLAVLYADGIRKKLHRDLYLFQSKEHGNSAISYVTFRNALKRAAKFAGISDPAGLVSTHSMRKTYMDNMYSYFEREYLAGRSSTNPLIAAKEAAGHVNIDNTQKYLSFKFTQVPDDVIVTW